MDRKVKSKIKMGNVKRKGKRSLENEYKRSMKKMDRLQKSRKSIFY